MRRGQSACGRATLEGVQKILDGLLLGPEVAVKRGYVGDRPRCPARPSVDRWIGCPVRLAGRCRTVVRCKTPMLAIQFSHGFTSSLRIYQCGDGNHLVHGDWRDLSTFAFPEFSSAPGERRFHQELRQVPSRRGLRLCSFSRNAAQGVIQHFIGLRKVAAIKLCLNDPFLFRV